ncbi:peptidoglycan editing factor PgeF [Salimicrobium flavidum]|uniref:Purine nucleoside phosphorylase n=1 Tax=Salimicrobium flavidum TaxID=570947 RepID=A0A1N7ILP7_9BACI|nr:peptidoglycan editing factor PgeF [Salimicrobium flavidum]SIS37911.1 conserved hypothetical protein [Salimicrobium flavidum]
MFVPASEKILELKNTDSAIKSGFTTRRGGFSAYPDQSLNLGLHIGDDPSLVLKNREAVAKEVGVPLSNWVFAEQVHGTEIQVVSTTERGSGAKELHTAIEGADGLICKDEDILLACFYADCVPLYFMDKSTGWIGIAHAGWKGSVNGLAGKMVRKLISEGARKDSLEMVIGPCISREKYEVDDCVAHQIQERFRVEVLEYIRPDTWMLDLKRLNREIAIDSGMSEKNNHTSEYCTYKEEELFFSHRRDHGYTGRMLGYIVRSRL